MLLTGAVILGVLCFVGANYYLTSYLSQAESRLAGQYAKRKIIVAKVDVPAGETLSTANLAVRQIPTRYLSSTTLGPDSLELVAGQKVMAPLKAGDPIDRGALERTDRVALSTTVMPGERAITFPVDEISSMSGMLVPGDKIDLMYTGPGTTVNSYVQPGATAAEPKDLTHVRLILQAVTVMATGKTTQKRIVATKNGGQEEVAMDFTTVTLKVTPQQAEQVLIGQKLGQLTAVLRNPDDKTVLDRLVLDETTFRQVDAAPSARKGNYIEMIVGGTGAMGGVRTKSEVEGPSLAAVVSAVRGSAAPAAPAAPAPSAGDVRSRLGIGGAGRP